MNYTGNKITMATPATSPPASIGFNCTSINELFICFDKLTDGSTLPSNVIDYVNPYGLDPKYLPEAVWFLLSSKEDIDTECGIWKIKEEAREVFSNSDIIGWKTTLEFYNGQVPHQHKSDYVMEVFNITMKRLDDDNEKKETSSLCRVYLVPTHEIVDNGTMIHLTPHTDLDANSSSSRIGSSRRTPEVNMNKDIEASTVAERFPFPDHRGEDLFEMDLLSRGSIDFFAGGNFLELKDLDNNPGSPSSSDNSSAMSISSNERFDTLALLQELDEPVLEQSDSGKKLDVFAANKPDEYVMLPATLGSLVSLEGIDSSSDESLKSTAGSAHISTSRSRDVNNKVAKRTKVDRRDEGPSSSRKPSGSRTKYEGGRKGSGMKEFRKKYLCFMSF